VLEAANVPKYLSKVFHKSQNGVVMHHMP